jgi:hypothetical protein
VGTGPRQLHGHAGRWGSARRPALQLQRRCRGRRVEAGPEKGVNKGDPPTPPTPSKPPGHAVDVLTPTLSRGTPNFHFHVPATFAAEQVTTFQRQFLGKVLERPLAGDSMGFGRSGHSPAPGRPQPSKPRDTEGPERSEDAEWARVCGNSIRMGLPARSSAARPTSTDISGRECSSTRTRSRPGAHLAGLVVPPTCGPARRPALQLQRRCPRGRQVGAGPEKGVNKGGPPKPLTPLKPQCHAVDVLTPTAPCCG